MALQATLFGHLWVLLAGAVGSIVPAAMIPEMSRRQRLVYVCIGMATAVFIAPGIGDHFLRDAGTYVRGAVSFTVGLVGMKLAATLIRLFDQHGQPALERLAGGLAGTHGSRPSSTGRRGERHKGEEKGIVR